jgi:hypothetical protein
MAADTAADPGKAKIDANPADRSTSVGAGPSSDPAAGARPRPARPELKPVIAPWRSAIAPWRSAGAMLLALEDPPICDCFRDESPLPAAGLF